MKAWRSPSRATRTPSRSHSCPFLTPRSPEKCETATTATTWIQRATSDSKSSLQRFARAFSNVQKEQLFRATRARRISSTHTTHPFVITHLSLSRTLRAASRWAPRSWVTRAPLLLLRLCRPCLRWCRLRFTTTRRTTRRWDTRWCQLCSRKCSGNVLSRNQSKQAFQLVHFKPETWTADRTGWTGALRVSQYRAGFSLPVRFNFSRTAVYPVLSMDNWACVQSPDFNAIQLLGKTVEGKMVINNLEIGAYPGIRVHETDRV